MASAQCPSTECNNPTPLISCDEIYRCSNMNITTFYYAIEITNPGQTLSINSIAFPGVTCGFDYTLSIVPPPSVANNSSPCNPNLIIQGQNVTDLNYTFQNTGLYILTIGQVYCESINICLNTPLDNCETCIGSFAPIPGDEYLIGAWVKEEQAPPTKVDYDQPVIYIHFTIDTAPLNPNNATTTATVGPFSPQGAIIDGWQRIEEKFIIPPDAIDMQIELATTGDQVLFDDIRVFPINGSMKTYVYDPINMRLAAELDERHYATFYEYDEEGKLVRIKKETERGVMTIQETKSNSKKSGGQ